MAIATGSQSAVGYLLETTYGVPVTGTVFNELRRKSAAGLNLTKDSYDSEEVRIDRQLADSRHGVRRAGGDVESELSVGSFTDLLTSLLGYDSPGNSVSPISRGWLMGSTITATGAGVVLTASTSRIAGLPTTARIGDRFAITGSATSGNNTTYTLVAFVTGTTFTVSPAPVADDNSGSLTATLSGYKATVGRVSTSYTLERAFTDAGVDLYQYFKGMKVNSASFALPSTGIATVTWNFLGQDASALGSSPVSTVENDGASPPNVYKPVSTKSVLAAVNGAIYINGVAQAVVTDLNFTIDNQLGGSEVVGKNYIPESLWGNTQMVTGKLTALFENNTLYNIFDAESTASIIFRMDGSVAGEWIQFTFPRCKFNSSSIGDAVATGLPLEIEFRALLPTSGKADKSQVVIQTSHLAS